jgi:hypothetical protein
MAAVKHAPVLMPVLENKPPGSLLTKGRIF